MKDQDEKWITLSEGGSSAEQTSMLPDFILNAAKHASIPVHTYICIEQTWCFSSVLAACVRVKWQSVRFSVFVSQI